jgi:hypothetical protein
MRVSRAVELVRSRGAWAGCASCTPFLVASQLGCTNQVAYTTDADVGSTHALVSIERSQNGDTERARALAGFARMPATVDSSAVLSLVGWSLDLPPPGQCAGRTGLRDPNTPLSPIDHIEFLEAGEVTLQTAGMGTTLAPHAFPTVTDWISGVVYTTRDRSAAALPAGTRYWVRASGGLGLSGLAVTTDAPATLDGLTVRGRPVSAVDEIVVTLPLEVTWKPGTGGDWVVVGATDVDATSGTWCTYRDEEGSATIPPNTIPIRGRGKLSLRRVRSHPLGGSGLSHGELRFDFETTVPTVFVDSLPATPARTID